MLAITEKIFSNAYAMENGDGDGERFTTVGMTVTARNALVAYCDTHFGSTQKLVLTAMVEWFVRQPPVVQRVVLGDTAGMEGAYASALEAMAREMREEVTRDALIRSNRQKESEQTRDTPARQPARKPPGGDPPGRGGRSR